jgi:4-hydroxy-3-methylbut-2-enyl diphosphate reductase
LKVIVASEAGYCYGVERALKMVKKALEDGKIPIYTLGPLIHNPQVVSDLSKKGVTPVSSLDEVERGYVVIRSHGVPPDVLEKAKLKGIKIIDATCPFVKKAQEKASLLSSEGYLVVIIGEKRHPEVIGLLGYAGGNSLVLENPEDIPFEILKREKIGVVVQTTQSEEKLFDIINKLIPFSGELRVFNTICNATQKRQEAARKLAQEVDVMIIVGGKNSANTTRLYQISKRINPRSFHIETAEEIKEEWFDRAETVGLTAGASTPRYLLNEVEKRVESIR